MQPWSAVLPAGPSARADTVEDTAGVFGKAVVDVGHPELVAWVRSLPLSLLM